MLTTPSFFVPLFPKAIIYIMEFKDLIKIERELTGMTQEALAERLNAKYQTSITPRVINIIESKGVIADANLRNVLLDDFYKLNLDRERKILAFAYNLADYLTDRKVSVDIPELFSFTCRDELIQYVNDRLMESKKVKKKGDFMLDLMGSNAQDSLEKNLQNFIKVELDYISDEIELADTSLTDVQDIKLNDSAKLVFYIVYYHFLLSEKKKSKKEKSFISKADIHKPGFEEVFRLYYPNDDIDDINKLSETLKGKVITNINNRTSFAFTLFETDILDFMLNVMRSTMDIWPEEIKDEEYRTWYELFNKLEEAIRDIESQYENKKDIDYNSENWKWLAQCAYQISLPQNRISIKDMFSMYYMIYQACVPSIIIVNRISEQLKEKKYFSLDKLKNTAEQSIEKEDQGSNKLKETAEQLVKDLNEKYEKYKGNFTEDQFYEFVYQQKYLFQLYKKHNTLHFYFERLKNIQQ